MSDSKPEKNGVRCEFTFRLVPEEGEPIVHQFSQTNPSALHPSHLNIFQLSFPSALDVGFRQGVLILVNEFVEDLRKRRIAEGRSQAGEKAAANGEGDSQLPLDFVSPDPFESSCAAPTPRENGAGEPLPE